MSTNNDNLNQVKIDGEDGDEGIDTRIKTQILELRQVVDDDERRLFVDRVQEVPEYTRTQATLDWGVSVRQYLRGIKRLWSDQENVPIPNVEWYWKKLALHPKGTNTVAPPDKNGFRFSLVAQREDYNDEKLRRAIGLGRNGEIPEPYEIELYGLNSILHSKYIEHKWVITTHKTGPPPEHNTEDPQIQMPIPKEILENAVEAADNFLQQAGLGFDVSPEPYRANEPGL